MFVSCCCWEYLGIYSNGGATNGYAIRGIVYAIVGNISEVQTTAKSCSTIIRTVDDLFILYHLRAMAWHDR